MTGRPADTDRAAALSDDLGRLPAVLRSLARSTRHPHPTTRHGGDAFHAAGALDAMDLPGRARRVVLTGLGSSRFAALQVAPLLRAAGWDTEVRYSSAAPDRPDGPDALVVGISASGSTPETVAALAAARAAGAATLAVTNRAASPLGDAAGAVADLGAGAETSGVSGLTYSATVALLLALGVRLGAAVDASAAMGLAADALEAILAHPPEWRHSVADRLDRGSPIHVIAPPDRLGGAEQAALLLRECPRLEATAYEAGDWLHVGLYTALPGCRAVLSAGGAYDARIRAVIAERGGQVLVVGPGADDPDGLTIPAAAADPWVRAIAEPAVMALVAAELWSRATGRASGPDRAPSPPMPSSPPSDRIAS